MIKVNFKKLKADAVKPTYGSQFAAGADLLGKSPAQRENVQGLLLSCRPRK